MAMVIPRGFRNNNPLNIEHVESNKWLGLRDPPSDGRFARFKSMDYGIRAAAVLLMRYYDRDGLDTVRKIVSKWAPSTENNTASYIAAVCKYTWFTSDVRLDLHDRVTMEKLIKAMAKHENGVEVDDIALNKGLALAGFPAPVLVSSVMSTPTMIAATSTVLPAAIVSVGALIDGLDGQANVIAGIVAAIGGPVAGSVALGVISGATWGWNLYQRLKIRNETGV